MRWLVFICVLLATPTAALEFEDYLRCATFEQAVDSFHQEGIEIDRRHEDVQYLASFAYDRAVAIPSINAMHRLAYENNDVILARMTNGEITPGLANAWFACKARDYP